MSATHFEIDTPSLMRDAAALGDQLNQVQTCIGAVTTALMELDQTWDGPANRSFMAQYSINEQSFEAFCNELNKLISCMEYAAGQYEICEQDVHTTIQAIRI